MFHHLSFSLIAVILLSLADSGAFWRGVLTTFSRSADEIVIHSDELMRTPDDFINTELDTFLPRIPTPVAHDDLANNAESLTDDAAAIGASKQPDSAGREVLERLAKESVEGGVRHYPSILEKSFAHEVNPKSKVYLVFPRDDAGYQAVYRKAPSRQDLAQLSRDSEYLQGVRNVTYAKDGDGTQAFGLFLKDSDEELIIIVGHNDKGQLRLLDSSEMPLRTLAEDCKYYEKKCVFISCRANSLLGDTTSVGIEGKVSFREAFQITRALKSELDMLKDRISLAEIDATLPSTLRRLELASKISDKITYKGAPVIAWTSVPLLLVSLNPRTN
jgi:hypothetical protein